MLVGSTKEPARKVVVWKVFYALSRKAVVVVERVARSTMLALPPQTDLKDSWNMSVQSLAIDREVIGLHVEVLKTWLVGPAPSQRVPQDRV